MPPASHEIPCKQRCRARKCSRRGGFRREEGAGHFSQGARDAAGWQSGVSEREELHDVVVGAHVSKCTSQDGMRAPRTVRHSHCLSHQDDDQDSPSPAVAQTAGDQQPSPTTSMPMSASPLTQSVGVQQCYGVTD